MRIKVPNVAYNRSTNGFVILSERSESKDLLPSPRSTVKSRERSFDCALRAPLRMTYGSDISASSVFRLLIRIVNCQRNKFLICGSVTGRGARRQLYLVPNVRNALAVGHADKSQFAALLGSLPGRQGKTACFNPIILYRLSWTSGYICAILKTKTVERGLRLCQK